MVNDIITKRDRQIITNMPRFPVNLASIFAFFNQSVGADFQIAVKKHGGREGIRLLEKYWHLVSAEIRQAKAKAREAGDVGVRFYSNDGKYVSETEWMIDQIIAYVTDELWEKLSFHQQLMVHSLGSVVPPSPFQRAKTDRIRPRKKALPQNVKRLKTSRTIIKDDQGNDRMVVAPLSA